MLELAGKRRMHHTGLVWPQDTGLSKRSGGMVLMEETLPAQRPGRTRVTARQAGCDSDHAVPTDTVPLPTTHNLSLPVRKRHPSEMILKRHSF